MCSMYDLGGHRSTVTEGWVPDSDRLKPEIAGTTVAAETSTVPGHSADRILNEVREGYDQYTVTLYIEESCTFYVYLRCITIGMVWISI